MHSRTESTRFWNEFYSSHTHTYWTQKGLRAVYSSNFAICSGTRSSTTGSTTNGRICTTTWYLHVSQGSILFSPHHRKPQYRNDITSRLSLSLDIAPFPLSLRLQLVPLSHDIISRLSLSLDIVPSPLSLRLFLDSEVTSHFPTVASSLLHRRDTVPPLTKIYNKDLPSFCTCPCIPWHIPYAAGFHIPGSYRSLIPVFASRNVTGGLMSSPSRPVQHPRSPFPGQLRTSDDECYEKVSRGGLIWRPRPPRTPQPSSPH
jgi:hypothetical protein